MGGKQKQAHRTKNNARPSNSGRSAELLGNSTGKLFLALKDNANFISAVNNQDIDSNINQDFQLVIKKISKKDPITRQKGLLEFTELCQSSNIDAVKAVLPLWPRLYSISATDIDYRVREACQLAHRAIVTSVKRDIAPYLKQLMGTWFVSFFDSHPSAANNAKTSFQSAFSPSKRTEAIVFAQKDILSHIAKNVIHETPETLASTKNYNVDDVRVKYQGIVVSNLLGYAHYLAKIPKDQLIEAKEDNKQLILNTNKFWKFAKDESKAIKAAWFAAVLAVIDKAPHYLEDSHKKLCTAVFMNMDDNNTNVLTGVWETVIRIPDIVQNWWTYVSPDKLIYPKLWHVLQEAGFGSATEIYPSLIPLVGKIYVPGVMKIEDFYSTLLSKLLSGLDNLKTLRNTSEMTTIIETFFEFFRYMVIIHMDEKEVYFNLIDHYLVSLMRNVIYEKSMFGISTTVFSNVSNILLYWNRLRNVSNVYDEITEKIFTSIRQFLCDSMSTSNLKDSSYNTIVEDDVEKKLNIHQQIIVVLKNPSDAKSVKLSQLKSGFMLEENNRQISPEKCITKDDEYYFDHLQEIAYDLIAEYYKLTLNADYPHLFINQLCNILNLFEEKRYYQRLTDVAIALSNSTANDESSQLIHNIICKWLSNSQVSVDAVLNVVFHLLVYLKDDEKVSVLNNISEDHMSSMMELCLNLTNDNQLQSSVRKWLSSSSFRSTLRSFAYEISKVYPPSMEEVNIIKTCFKVPKNGESYTDDETKLEILKVFRDSLLHNSSPTNSPQQLNKDNLSCIAQILAEVFKEHNYPLIKNNHLIITSTIGYLFLYGCDMDNQVEEDDILNEAWILGVRTLATIFGCVSNDFINVTEQFAFAVIELVEKSKCKIQDMKHVISFVCKYIECLPMSVEDKRDVGVRNEDTRFTHDDEMLSGGSLMYANVTSLICEIFLKIAVQYCHANMENNVVNACLKGHYYHGILTFRLPSSQGGTQDVDLRLNNDVKYELDVSECFCSVAKLFNVAYYIVTVVNNYLLVASKDCYNKEASDGNESKSESRGKSIEEPFLSKHGLEKLNESLVYVIYLLAVLKSFNKNFKHARYYDQVSESDLKELESITTEIVKMHSRSPILLLKLAIMNKGFQCGGFWAEALFLLFTNLMGDTNVNEAYHEILKCHDISDHRKKSYLLHISELFATVVQFRVELYSPDAKLDEEKLSILTSYLRANEDCKFTSDQDRVIWYWLDTILIHKKQLEITFNKNLLECKPSDIILSATVCRFLSVVSDGKIPLMTDKRTDFMMIALASWMQSIHKTCSNPTYEDNSQYNLPICIFISAVCDMFRSMTKLASNVGYSDKLFIEWNNVFAAETHTIISYNWKSLAESEGCRNVEQFLVLNTLSGLIITHVDFIQFVVRPDLNFWLCACSDLIQNYCASVRLAAFYILSELSLEMVSQDSCLTVVEDMEEKLTLEILSISSLQTIVNIVLSSYINGDNIVLDPNTDSYVYVHSYLLVWMVVIRMCENAPPQVRYRYASWLKEEGYMEIFLHNLLTLMPEKVQKNNLSDSVIKKIKELFSNDPKFTSEEQFDFHKLTVLVYRLYYMSLWLLPAFVRQWWKSLEHKDALNVDKLTTKFVSPSLIMEEMKAIKREKPIEKFTMKGYPATRQIVAAYTVEDTTMEITMQLAPNHPLGIVKIDSSKIGILSTKWKTWSKQLKMYLVHQNGLIRDGIMSWKNNVDKAFEGVEECYICFSIVHSSNYELPKKSCKTCSKKFHPYCLYKWFMTSNKSSCPICRNHF